MKTFMRMLRELYSGPYQAALVFSFTFVAALTIAVGAWAISTTVNNYLSRAMNERVARDAHLAVTFYDLRLREMSAVVSQLAYDPTIADNLKAAASGDTAARQALETEILNKVRGGMPGESYFVAILDSRGVITAGALLSAGGGQTIATPGGNWGGLPIVRAALAGETILASTEIIPQEYLVNINLDQQAVVALLDTPKAAPQPYDPREGTAGLAIFGAAPIFDPDGQRLGVAIAFHMFNNDFTIVDQIKDAAQIDTVTIFLGDLRVSTNVMTETGERAVGTRLSQEVAEVVLQQGTEYVGEAFVVNQNYITRYEPLRDHTGQVVGVLYVGTPQSSFTQLLNTLTEQIFLVAAITILMTFILATPVSRFITRPLKDLRELVYASRRVIEGDLDARASVTAGGEVGLVAKSFNNMLDALRSTREQLIHSENLASLGQLAAGVAHELNNPLATVLLYSESMLKERAEADPDNKDLRTIVSETKRCKRIVSDLLNFARQNQVVAQPTDIHAIIDELLEIAPRRIKTVKVDFVKDFDPNLPIIEGDPIQLRQVLSNLLINAVEAMPEGGAVTICTRTEPPGMITIEIQDTGVGIPPESLNKLFAPFFTTKPMGKGIGLGLSIVYGIVKMHSGQIRAKSQVNKGTTFTINLPIHLSPSRQDAPENRFPVSNDKKTMIG
ncbi:MAG: integral membrane sensor signal transduction histidine kinase [Anaerolineaceae bacterium]|nr:MAG: integral membrane sensor signal transduction histidine kinase [Anaerolineaceae bacterium]